MCICMCVCREEYHQIQSSPEILSEFRAIMDNFSEGWSYSSVTEYLLRVLAEFMRDPSFSTQYWKEKKGLPITVGISILSISITHPVATAIFPLPMGLAHGVHSLASV